MKTKKRENLIGSMGPVKKVSHDLHLDNVTSERFWQAQEFIRACEAVACWKLEQGEQPGNASSYLKELAAQLASSIRTLVEAGDVMLARGLPGVVSQLQSAGDVYGWKLTPIIENRLSIEELLREHRPIELIQMIAAAHSDWAEMCGIEDGKKFLAGSEEQLREYLITPQVVTGRRDGKKFTEQQQPPLTQLIEQFWAIREMQQPNINCFVEHLWRGRLWSGPNGTYEKCDWPSRPDRDDVSAWMAIIMPYLKQVTNGDAMKLGVFRDMIAARGYCFDGITPEGEAKRGTRLKEANPSDVWNQVGAEIRKAWQRMAKQARKPKSKNPA